MLPACSIVVFALHLGSRGITRREALAATTLLPTLLPTQRALAVEDDDYASREVMTTVTSYIGKDRKPVSVSRRRFTGAGAPEWTFPSRDVTSLVVNEPFPVAFPFTSADDFKRLDEDEDTNFYKQPKLVYHIDEGAVASLTHYYESAISDGSDVLDICSSWVSHYPRSFPTRMKSIAGTGISQVELSCNDQLTSFKQADLNVNPRLPFETASIDVVTPLEVMKEVVRVLRPGGKVILSQSNRCFYSKAVGVWRQDMSDVAHLRVLATYMYFTKGLGDARILDISARGPGTNDPMYVVEARKA